MPQVLHPSRRDRELPRRGAAVRDARPLRGSRARQPATGTKEAAPRALARTAAGPRPDYASTLAASTAARIQRLTRNSRFMRSMRPSKRHSRGRIATVCALGLFALTAAAEGPGSRIRTTPEVPQTMGLAQSWAPAQAPLRERLVARASADQHRAERHVACT